MFLLPPPPWVLLDGAFPDVLSSEPEPRERLHQRGDRHHAPDVPTLGTQGKAAVC